MTTNLARSASCCATCLDSTAFVNCVNKAEGWIEQQGRQKFARPSNTTEGSTRQTVWECTLTSVPNDRCVMATSSTNMLNSLALSVRLSRTCKAHMDVKLSRGRVFRLSRSFLTAEQRTTLHFKRPHRLGHFISLCQQLLCVVLGNNSLDDLIPDGRQNTLVPVQAQALKHARKRSGPAAVECNATMI